ncbi:hypothetical protein HW555_003991 [Spodoptera exigua]|uniref:Uncharacterized protein n=1 Tax=Spodoptera exigua TaxID=7107 RepID=A0A835GL20_SPOEX|nr:hypothetical protein HW555_003991 [Spodoptera exigua]
MYRSGSFSKPDSVLDSKQIPETFVAGKPSCDSNLHVIQVSRLVRHMWGGSRSEKIPTFYSAVYMHLKALCQIDSNTFKGWDADAVAYN